MNKKLFQIIVLVIAGFCIYALHNFIILSKISDNRIRACVSLMLFFLVGTILGIFNGKYKRFPDFFIYFILLAPVFFDVHGLYINKSLFPIITPINTLIKIFGFYLGYNLSKRNVIFYSVLLIFTPLFFYVIFIFIQNFEYKQLNNDFVPKTKLIDLSLLTRQKRDTIDRKYFKDKVLLLDFFFLHCRPCIEKFPSLEKLKIIYLNRKDVEIAGVYCDVDNSMDELAGFLTKHKISLTTYIDEDMKLCKKIGIKSYPLEIIVNKRGEIISTYWGFKLGASEKYIEERTKLINDLLKEKL